MSHGVSSFHKISQSRHRSCFWLPFTAIYSNADSIPSSGSCIRLSDFSKKLYIHSSSSSLNSFFFLPDSICTAIGRLNFEERFPITWAFFCGLDGSDLSVLWTYWLKNCFAENAENALDIGPEVDVAVPTNNWLFLNGIPRHEQLLSSWILRTFLALDIFFFLFQFFFSLAAWLAFRRPPFFWQ